MRGFERRRHQQTGSIFQVLGGVIVKFTGGNHFTGNRSDGFFIAEHGALNLSPHDRLLYEDFTVEIAGSFESLLKLLAIARLADAHRRAQIGRLDEHRIAEFFFRRQPNAPPIYLNVHPANRQIWDDRQTAFAEQPLHHILVHAHRRPEHARAHIGNSRQLEPSLHRAVFSKRTVQHREDYVQWSQALVPPSVFHRDQRADVSVDAGGAGGGDDLHSLLGNAFQRRAARPSRRQNAHAPAAFFGNRDGNDFVLVGVGGGHHVARRLQRNVVFRRASPEQYSNAQFFRHPADRQPAR